MIKHTEQTGGCCSDCTICAYTHTHTHTHAQIKQPIALLFLRNTSPQSEVKLNTLTYDTDSKVHQ